MLVRAENLSENHHSGSVASAQPLARAVQSQRNQVWVCDITYLEVERSRFAYLFVLTDLFSRYSVGWHMPLLWLPMTTDQTEKHWPV